MRGIIPGLGKAGVLLVLLLCMTGAYACKDTGLPIVSLANLPLEAAETYTLIQNGGPYPHTRDGIVFNNYEKRLPIAKRGYYEEYTVRTPGVKNRGARRLIVGGRLKPPAKYFYTDDHYKSFQCIQI